MNLRAVLDLIYPRECAVCSGALAAGGATAFCDACDSRLEWGRPPFCPRCGAGGWGGDCAECRGKELHFTGATALGRYEGALRETILRLKFRGSRHLADDFGRRLAGRLGRRFDGVAPVPMSRWKLLVRGYNAADLLAERVARHSGLPYLAGLLRKVRRTRPQADLSLEERLTNPRGAYRARRIRGSILLVDDVLTTGATANACAEALRQAGASDVHLAVLAR